MKDRGRCCVYCNNTEGAEYHTYQEQAHQKMFFFSNVSLCLQFSTQFNFFCSFFFSEKMILATYPILIVMSQIDLLKDVLLSATLIIYNGGPYIVATHPTLFSSNVSFLKSFYQIDYYSTHLTQIVSHQAETIIST